MKKANQRGGGGGGPGRPDDQGQQWKVRTPVPDQQHIGPGGFTFPMQNRQGSPAGCFPGSNTPQYSGSPAPSGASTPGPGSPQSYVGHGFPAAQKPHQYCTIPGPSGSPSLAQLNRSKSTESASQAFERSPNFQHSMRQGGPGVGRYFPMPNSSQFPNSAEIERGHMMMSGGNAQLAERMNQAAANIPRRSLSNFNQTEYRILELNKRLQMRTEESDNCWWDAFVTDFFEDDATLSLTFGLEDGPKRFTIGRTLIPRYFRSIFEDGVTELYFHLTQAKESMHNTFIILDCDQCTLITHHGNPFMSKVCTEGRLVLEFMCDDYMRVKTWNMAVRTHSEFIPKSIIGMHRQPNAPSLDHLTKNITRHGITNSTLNYLRLCVILEPMQELMTRHKAQILNPRDCLKTTLYQKWQGVVAPAQGKRDAPKTANKRRKKKGATPAASPSPAAKKRSPDPNSASTSMSSQDVMVVGEPSLMGDEFGDQDRIFIYKVEKDSLN